MPYKCNFKTRSPATNPIGMTNGKLTATTRAAGTGNMCNPPRAEPNCWIDIVTNTPVAITPNADRPRLMHMAAIHGTQDREKSGQTADSVRKSV